MKKILNLFLTVCIISIIAVFVQISVNAETYDLLT